jgi:tRNA dimethylallyltransferase
MFKTNLIQKLSINQDPANVLFIVGPTASGKTSLAIQIAQEFQKADQPTSIISADSRQIYKDMTICTAKPVERIEETQKDKSELYLEPIQYKKVDHYLFDIVEPNQRYTLFDFQEQAQNLINKLHKKNHKVIVAGGTGLYIDSLINNYQHSKINTEDKDYKNKLIQQHTSITRTISRCEANISLWNQLNAISPKEAAKIDQNNWQGVIRALEVIHSASATKSSLSSKSKPDFSYQLIVLNPNRQDLYNHINKRCLEMFEQGMIDETKHLIQKYSTKLPSMTSIGYRQVNQMLNNEITKEEAITQFQQATRRYAKRQLTWFRRYKEYSQAKFIDSYKLLQSDQ